MGVRAKKEDLSIIRPWLLTRFADRIPLAIWLLVSIASISIASIWAFASASTESSPVKTVLLESPITGDQSIGPAIRRLDPSVLRVTLVDDLFPKPPEPAPPPPLPTLDLRLIAITIVGDERRAFVHDESSGRYLELGVGETAPGGAVLIKVDDQAAVFEVPLGGDQPPATVRLELTQ